MLFKDMLPYSWLRGLAPSITPLHLVNQRLAVIWLHSLREGGGGADRASDLEILKGSNIHETNPITGA